MASAFESPLYSNESIPPVSPPGRIEINEQDLAPAFTAPNGLAAPAVAPGSGWLPVVKASTPMIGASYCRACGNQMDQRAVMCPRCGVPTENHAMTQSASMVNLAVNSKSGGVAILLSLLFTGAGQWYCGHVGRGFAFWGAAVVSWFLLFFVIGFVLLPIVVIWAAIDANKLVEQHNRQLLTSVTGVVA